MFVVVAYDVNTETPEGRTRLRKVSKICQNYGQRMQNSLFECNIDYGTFLKIKAQLEKTINKEKDSLRFYNLGNKWECKIEHIGTKEGYNSEGAIII